MTLGSSRVSQTLCVGTNGALCASSAMFLTGLNGVIPGIHGAVICSRSQGLDLESGEVVPLANIAALPARGRVISKRASNCA